MGPFFLLYSILRGCQPHPLHFELSEFGVSEFIPNPNSRNPQLQSRSDSKKLFNFFARLGCRNFLRAFASICRILSRVTSKSCPTSSRVWSYFSPMPKPHPQNLFLSRGQAGKDLPGRFREIGTDHGILGVNDCLYPQ